MKRVALPVVIATALCLIVVAGFSMSSSITAEQAPAYIGNLKSYVFHRQTCSCLPAEMNRTSFSSRMDAIDAGYRPCRRCCP